MKAAVLEEVRKVTVREIPTPKPEQGMALVRVRACGVCLTDYKAYSGERNNVTFPVIVGHEFSGVVEEVGKGVSQFRPGDEVVVSPTVSCGLCSNCRRGFPHYCRYGATIGGDGMEKVLPGAFAEYVLVPEQALYRKPSSVSFEAAALTEPLAGCYKGLIEYSGMKVGEDLVIIGAGSMGLLLTMLAHRAGAGYIVLLDVDSWRLEFARKLHATYTVNIREVDPVEAVAEILPDGPDLVFEAAGTLEAAELAFRLTRRGTRVNEFGVTTGGEISVSPRDIHFRETRVDASFSVTPRAMQAALRLLERNLVDPTKIITHQFSLEEIEAALLMMEKRKRVKVMIIP